MKTEKQKKVGTIRHEHSGIEVDFFLRGTRFVATVLEEEISAPEAAILRKQVEDRLEHWLKLEWFPIIEINVDRSGYGGDKEDSASVEINIERFYLSRSPAGRVVRVEWDTDEIHRKAKMKTWDNSRTIRLTKLPLIAPLVCSSEETLVDFDDDLWRNLKSVVAAVKDLRKKLSAMIANKAGIARLTAATPTLLLKDK